MALWMEEALHVAVEEEVRKDMRAGGRVDVEDMSNAVFRRIYDDEQSSLMVKFREKMGYPALDGFSLTQSKEFTYWLFKHRLYYWDPARVASDTRKGLNWLERVPRLLLTHLTFNSNPIRRGVPCGRPSHYAFCR